MAIDERNVKQRIRRLLQDEEVQARVQENIRRGREDAKVTIGRASELFDLKPTKLRELDDLLQPGRLREPGSGQRQYSLSELKKLAIISELLNNEKIPASDIPPEIDEIWASVSSSDEEPQPQKEPSNELHTDIFVDQRVENANKQAFMRFFVSQALRLALSLICEDIPDVVAGIILPLERKMNATSVWESDELAQLGECLIGWRDQNRSFVTFYTTAPSFEFFSDFRVRGLQAADEQEPQDRTFVFLQRKAKLLNLSQQIVETVRRLLTPIYEDINTWKPYFAPGMRDVVSQASSTIPHSMLTSFAEMMIRLGGKTESGQNRWKFCTILLPNNPFLSLQMRTLIVQAQSSESPHEIGKTFVTPDNPILSLSQRAFQSSRVLYRPLVSAEDATIEYRELEGVIRSAIAVPVEGRTGLPIAILYLVSEQAEAFGIEYQRVLRMIERMIGSLLDGQQNDDGLRDIIAQPQVVNKTLGSFASENDFIQDVKEILCDILKEDSNSESVTSFISIDVDNLSSYTSKYGDQTLINLSKALGTRIEEQMGFLFSRPKDCKLYHIYADRFYLSLKNVSLSQARENADKLRNALNGNYTISILPTSVDQLQSKVPLEGITVRLNVSSYQHTKLLKLLNKRPPETCIVDVLAGSVLYFLDVGLNIAKQAGGNCIASYHPPEPPYEHSRFALWSPPTT